MVVEQEISLDRYLDTVRNYANGIVVERDTFSELKKLRSPDSRYYTYVQPSANGLGNTYITLLEEDDSLRIVGAKQTTPYWPGAPYSAVYIYGTHGNVLEASLVIPRTKGGLTNEVVVANHIVTQNSVKNSVFLSLADHLQIWELLDLEQKKRYRDSSVIGSGWYLEGVMVDNEVIWKLLKITGRHNVKFNIGLENLDRAGLLSHLPEVTQNGVVLNVLHTSPIQTANITLPTGTPNIREAILGQTPLVPNKVLITGNG
jgi:hypothetical protein